MFVHPNKMFLNQPIETNYEKTVEWLKEVQRKSSPVFEKLGQCLQNKCKIIPYELKRTDTIYQDGSWSPLFRVLRPERIENVVNIIDSYEFDADRDEEIQRATHLYHLVQDIAKRWNVLIDQFSHYYADSDLGERLRSKFARLATYCKLFVLDEGRITSGEIYDKDSYRIAFNEFVKYYEELPSTTATVSEDKAVRKDIVKAAYTFAAEREEKMKHDPSNPKFKLLEVVRFFYQNTKRWESEKWIVKGRRLAYEPKGKTPEAIKRAVKSLSAAVRRERKLRSV